VNRRFVRVFSKKVAAKKAKKEKGRPFLVRVEGAAS